MTGGVNIVRITLVAVIAFLILPVGFVLGADITSQAIKTDLAPSLEVKIGDFGDQSDFASGLHPAECPPGMPVGTNNCIEINWISQYIRAVFRFGVGLAAILAVIMMMIGGFLWLVSGGSPDKVSRAKEFITSALYGLVIALTSVLILNTVNPELTALKPLIIPEVQSINNPNYGSTTGPTTPKPSCCIRPGLTRPTCEEGSNLITCTNVGGRYADSSCSDVSECHSAYQLDDDSGNYVVPR